jgi:Protein of unknown function (DUF1572)
MSVSSIFLDSAKKRFLSYKDLGDRTFSQLEERDFFLKPNETSNSIAQIIRHLSGNMISRWTNFLTEDGEKPWRNRDSEFDLEASNKEELLNRWEKGWDCLLNTLQNLQETDLEKTVYIRNEPLIVIDAINRQLAHYPHHVGQIVYIGKLIKSDGWKNLSIEKGKSEAFNLAMQKKTEK